MDKNEIDRVLAVPLDMLCSARYARLCEDYHPTAALDQEGEEEWSRPRWFGPRPRAFWPFKQSPFFRDVKTEDVSQNDQGLLQND